MNSISPTQLLLPNMAVDTSMVAACALLAAAVVAYIYSTQWSWKYLWSSPSRVIAAAEVAGAAKLPGSDPPPTISGSHEPLTSEELLKLSHAAFISYHNTWPEQIKLDSERDLADLRYINTYEELKDIKELWQNRKNHARLQKYIDDAQHVPILTIGSHKSNHTYACCSYSAQQQDMLYVAVRPLEISITEELGIRNPAETLRAAKHLLQRAKASASGSILSNRAPEEKTAKVTIDLIGQLANPELQQPSGFLSRTYHRLVNEYKYPVTVLNTFETNELKVPSGDPGPLLTAPSPNMHMTNLKQPQANDVADFTYYATMADTVESLLLFNPNRFKKVVFTGFSKGAGTSLACAYSVASRIQNRVAQHAAPAAKGRGAQAALVALRSMTFECIQFAGTTVGTNKLKQACEELNIRTYYVALEDSSADNVGTDRQFDLVTYMPYGGLEHIHVADRFFILDLAAGSSASKNQEDSRVQPLKLYNTTYNRWRCLNTLKVNSNTVKWMAAAFILGDLFAAKTGLHGFKYIHMRGEEALRRLFMVEVLRKQLLNDWMQYNGAQ